MTDEEFLRQFEDCTYPFDQWDHRAHVKTAFLYLRDHSFDRALEKMRSGIQAYNAANDGPEGPTVGYHETTTVAFMRLIATAMSAYGELYPTPDADSFCDRHTQLMSKHVLRLFYSPERLGSPTAKTQFVEPDRGALQSAPGKSEST